MLRFGCQRMCFLTIKKSLALRNHFCYTGSMENNIKHWRISFADKQQNELFDTWYKQLYEPNFPEEERFTLDGYKEEYKRLIQTGCIPYFSVATDKDKIVGGISGLMLNEINTAFGGFVVVDNNIRGRGLAKEMIQQFITDTKTNRLVAEVEDPSKFQGKEREVADHRLGFYEKLGAKVLDMKFLNGVIAEGQQPLDSLMLIVMQKENKTSMSKEEVGELLLNILTHVYAMEDAGNSPQYQQMMASIKADGVPLVPVSEKRISAAQEYAAKNRSERLTYRKLTAENLREWVNMQKDIFGKECVPTIDGCVVVDEELRKTQPQFDIYTDVEYYIAYDENNKPVGTTGLYKTRDSEQSKNGIKLLDPKKNEMWLGWFGVLPNTAGKGYGSEILRWTEELAKSRGSTTLRYYTEIDGNSQAGSFGTRTPAINLYRKHGFTEEKYTHPEAVNFNRDFGIDIVVGSKSLEKGKEVKPWNNQYMDLTRAFNSHRLSTAELDALLETTEKKFGVRKPASLKKFEGDGANF